MIKNLGLSIIAQHISLTAIHSGMLGFPVVPLSLHVRSAHRYLLVHQSEKGCRWKKI